MLVWWMVGEKFLWWNDIKNNEKWTFSILKCSFADVSLHSVLMQFRQHSLLHFILDEYSEKKTQSLLVSVTYFNLHKMDFVFLKCLVVSKSLNNNLPLLVTRKFAIAMSPCKSSFSCICPTADKTLGRMSFARCALKCFVTW